MRKNIALLLLIVTQLGAATGGRAMQFAGKIYSTLRSNGRQMRAPTTPALSCHTFSPSPLVCIQQAYRDSTDENKQQQGSGGYDRFLVAGAAAILGAKIAHDTYSNSDTKESPFFLIAYAAEHPEWAQEYMRKSSDGSCYYWHQNFWPASDTIAENIVPIVTSSEVWGPDPAPSTGWRTFPLLVFLEENEKYRSKIIQAIADDFEAIMKKDDEGIAICKCQAIMRDFPDDAKLLIGAAVANIGSLLKERGDIEQRWIYGLNGAYVAKRYNIIQNWGAIFLQTIILRHPKEVAQQVIHCMPKVVQDNPMVTCRGDDTARLIKTIFETYPEVRQPLTNAVLNAFSSIDAFLWERDFWIFFPSMRKKLRDFDYAGYFDLLQHVFSQYPELRPSIAEFVITNLISKRKRMNASESIQIFILTILREYPDQREVIINAIDKNKSMLMGTTYGKKLVHLSKRLEDPMPDQAVSGRVQEK